MATIPIEVIVQDAEAPIVPSEDATNTNITVPDTGTISNNGDTWQCIYLSAKIIS